MAAVIVFSKLSPRQQLSVAIAVLAATLSAAAQPISLRGQVADESGAVLPAAIVTIDGASGSRTAKTDASGNYAFTDLAPGTYRVSAEAPQLRLREPQSVEIAKGAVTLNLVLEVVAEKQQVTVADNSKPALSTEASANASALVMRGTDLDALSDNPDDLAADLQALAGPSAGPNGGVIYIDGFSGGQLPAKNSIREVRINQNPFSPEYDKLGFGRIEIFTKPGSDRFHADLGYNFATDKWNSRNPYAGPKAPFLLHELREMVSGPLGKRASFNLTATREWVDNGNAVNAVVLEPRTLAVTAFTATPVAQLRRTAVTPRFDYQLSANHTLSVRYAYNRDIVRNAGTGGFQLESRGYHNDARSQTLQVTETAVLAASVINETRFQYFHPVTKSQANSTGPAVQVLGSFSGGANPVGHSTDSQHNSEFQNYTSWLHGSHMFRWGGRWRYSDVTDLSPQNFAGTFVFSGGLAPALDAAFQPLGGALVNISSIESYRRTLYFLGLGIPAAQIRALGGGASQFSINAGDAAISGSQWDIGVFAGDDWRARPNLTLSYGIRYEAQSNIGDARGIAPRVGVAWAPGAKSKQVLRAGFGMFYDRFALVNTLDARRYNGVRQLRYIMDDPDFFPFAPPASVLRAAPASTAQISSSLRAPYLMQTAAGYERQLPWNTTAAVTYAYSHGLHLLRSRDINAPLNGVCPLGRQGLAVLMESSGLLNQNQLLVNVNSKVNANVSLTGLYAYGRAMSNTDGLGTFPANPYSMEGEYGPSAMDMRHRVSLGGTLALKWGVRLNPLLTANSGPPFDITSGRDVNGDTLFLERPALATDASRTGVIQTIYGLLDPNPPPGVRTLPRNYGRGPGQIMLNLRVGRTINFGSREGHAPVSTNPGGVSGGPARNDGGSPFAIAGAGGGGTSSRRYSLAVSMQVRNVANHNNPGPIIGSIASPLFGRANQPAGSGNAIFSESANNRRLELQMRLTF